MTAGPWSSREAHYRCLQCQHEWHGKAGPTQCPACGHLYVKWLNYEDPERVAKKVEEFQRVNMR